MTKHFIFMGVGFLGLLFLIGIFTGTAPVSPRSHAIIHEAVAENPALDTLFYKHVSEQLYISINDSDHLFDQWLEITKLRDSQSTQQN